MDRFKSCSLLFKFKVLVFYLIANFFYINMTQALTCEFVLSTDQKSLQVLELQEAFAKKRDWVKRVQSDIAAFINILNFEDITQLRKENIGGKGNNGGLKGILNSNEVFVKTSNFGTVRSDFSVRTTRELVTEMTFGYILGELELGPKLLGITTTPEGHFAFVYEYKDGSPVQLVDSYLNLTEKQFYRLKELEIILNFLGIRPLDLNLIADKNGTDLYIIDSEYFRLVEPFVPEISFSFHANRKGISEEVGGP